MFAYFIVLGGLLGLDVYWAWRAASYARRLPYPLLWKTLIGLFTSLQLLILTVLFAMRPFVGRFDFPLPQWVLATTYIWHILVLPAVIGPGIAYRMLRLAWQTRSVPGPRKPVPVTSAAEPTRRQMLVAAAVAATPPLLTGGLLGMAYQQRYQFRVRDLIIPVPALPPDLDGLRIAHLSDTHIGAFTNDRILRSVTDATNTLKADLVCFTGDLIDFSLRDLSSGFDFINRLDPRHGLAICVGNHDLFQSAPEFRSRMLQARMPLLLNGSRDITIRGQTVQLLGLDWGKLTYAGPHNIEQHMARISPQVQRDGAFPILLAHHPHALDPAETAGIPLVLSGHTHGGQMNLTNRIGGGPMMFKYWSGMYSKNNSRLVVSNGIGGWFPLRVNAPAEIVNITLRRA